jgi:hypothetical protein
MSNYKIVRLTTGEEVICNLLDAPEGKVKLSKPLLLIPTGEGAVTFATWLPYNSDEHVIVSNKDIMFTITPVEGMTTKYAEVTGSLILNNQKIIA